MACEINSPVFTGNGSSAQYNLGGPHDSDFDLSGIIQYNQGLSDNNGFKHPNSHNPGPDHNAASPAGMATGGLNNTLTPEPEQSMYPAEFGSAPSSPYFQQSIEQPMPSQPQYGSAVPSPLRQQYLHRRSVSEPPDGAMIRQHQQFYNVGPQPPPLPVTFHRDGHSLGDPKPHAPFTHAGAKKAKQLRSQPYRRAAPQPTSKPKPPYPYDLRRAQTQPGPGGPTSMPVQRPQQFQPRKQMQMQQPLPHPMMQHPFNNMPCQPMSEEQQIVSSRLCTPEPTPRPSGFANSPDNIDPLLQGPVQSPSRGMMNVGSGANTPNFMQRGHVQKAVVMKLGVEELKALITEVVQKAVEGLERRLSKEKEKEAEANAVHNQTIEEKPEEGDDAKIPVVVDTEMDDPPSEDAELEKLFSPSGDINELMSPSADVHALYTNSE